MTTPRHETNTDPRALDHHPAGAPGSDGRSPHGGHGLMMMLMCTPMLLIAGFLVVTGAGGTGVIPALVCLGMMATMMFMMPGGHSHK